MKTFDDMFAHLVGIEGGYSDHASDRGGKTRFGITEAVARASGFTGEMKALPLDQAKVIAKARYWDIQRLDDVLMLSPRIAYELLDTGYNMGVVVAGRFLQNALNALNRQGRDYPDMVVDGLVGPATLSGLSGFLAKRGDAGERVMMAALNGQQLSRYLDIARRNPSQEDFMFGWISARVVEC